VAFTPGDPRITEENYRDIESPGDFFDTTDYVNDADLNLPFVREEPKTGRNDPCPCGRERNTRSAAGEPLQRIPPSLKSYLDTPLPVVLYCYSRRKDYPVMIVRFSKKLAKKNLVRKLSNELSRKRISGVSYRSLELFKRFYLEYPRIVQTLSAQSGSEPVLSLPPIHQTSSDESVTNLAKRSDVPVEKELADFIKRDLKRIGKKR
jgi:hypothetical protein